MSDLISRQAAIETIANCTNCGTPDVLRKYVDKHSLENGWTGGVLDAMEAVEDMHADDVAPVVHGKWINGRCNKCGEHAPFWAMASTYYTSNFCPNCGAKMDGEE